MTATTGSGPTTYAASPTADAPAAPKDPIDKIIVAIHGIGSQSRSGTIRSVASRFGDRCEPPLPVMPLGFFNLGEPAEVRISYLETSPHDASLKNVGFAEIFWADIPEGVVKENDLLEETKAWGRTVVSRAEAAYRRYLPQGGQLEKADFELGVGVVEEIIETIGVLENLLAVAAKAGVFKFDLGPLLRDYIGDVQLVADFPFQREKILYRFHSALGKIVDAFAELNRKNGRTSTPEIYIVAHSEGTVISFLGMLQAFGGGVATDPEKKGPDVDSRKWITSVRGYMTIGSPIDKHIVLWPALWEKLKFDSHPVASGGVVFEGTGQPPLTLAQKIKWRNYYDYGDPIGFQLDTAVELLHKTNCRAFEFDTQTHDFGFSRYLLPGQAHNDYWTDKDVFGHFIDDVVFATGKAEPPKSRWYAGPVGLLIPYLLVFLLHFAAVFALFKGVAAWSGENDADPAFEQLTLQILLLSGLLTSVTVAARLPRLVKTSGFRWELAAFLVFLLGAVPCAWALPAGVAEFLSQPFTWVVSWLNSPEAYVGRAALLVVAFGVAVSGWLIPRKPALGRRVLIGLGTLVIAIIVAQRLHGESKVPAWPVVLAGLAFLYLWWLAILLFDLTFVWHRYIRRSVAIDTLRQWRRNQDATPNPMLGLGPRRRAPERQAP